MRTAGCADLLTGPQATPGTLIPRLLTPPGRAEGGGLSDVVVHGVAVVPRARLAVLPDQVVMMMTLTGRLRCAELAPIRDVGPAPYHPQATRGRSAPTTRRAITGEVMNRMLAAMNAHD